MKKLILGLAVASSLYANDCVYWLGELSETTSVISEAAVLDDIKTVRIEYLNLKYIAEKTIESCGETGEIADVTKVALDSVENLLKNIDEGKK